MASGMEDNALGHGKCVNTEISCRSEGPKSYPATVDLLSHGA